MPNQGSSNFNYKQGKRELTINLKKNGNGNPSGTLSIPMQWIRELSIDTTHPKNIVAECKNGKIIIEKNNK